jgi:hypothetical protein
VSFENPWMLLGLLSLALPLWLHFRHRREQRIAFPAVAVLRRVASLRAPRLRLRRLLLLIARLLALIALVMAMARPGLLVTRPGGIRSGMALAQVIVIDDSLSMRQLGADGATAFQRAVDIALAEIGRLRPGDGASVLLAGRPARAVVEDLEFDLDRLRAKIDQIDPGYRAGDIEGALRIAARLLEDSPLPQREVLVITDLADAGWQKRGMAWSSESGIGFRVLAAVSGPVPDNATVERVRVSPSGEGIQREVEIEARVVNHGKQAIEGLDVVLELDDQEVARASLDVPAGGAATKRFHHRCAEEGAHRGHVRIPADALAEDDLRHFVVVASEALKLLVIDGDYRPGSYEDEAFYLRRALETPAPGEVPIRTFVVDEETAETGPLGGYDVVFLAGVDRPSATLSDRLIDYVRGGGGLFVAPGRVGGKLEGLAAVLPAAVRSVRKARTGRPLKVAAINRAHPVFELFGEGPTGLEQTRVSTHLLVEPDPVSERSVLAELAGGVPLLLERSVDRGAVMLLTTTLDRDWTDLPIRPGYLPLMQRAARHLAGRLGEREPRRVRVGAAVELEVSRGMQRIVVLAPGGDERAFPAKELTGRTKVVFDKTDRPGSYRVWAEVPDLGGLVELISSEFVVEVDPAESDLTHRIDAIAEEEGQVLAAAEGRLPIWPYLLLLAVLFLLAETGFAGSGLRRSHARVPTGDR